MHPDDRAFLDRHPDLAQVDVLLPDMNGVLRGKRIEATLLDKLFESGLPLPSSILGTTIGGETAEATGLGFDVGDRDLNCRPVPGSLRAVPWRDDRAQVIVTMEADGEPVAFEPRRVLERVCGQLVDSGLHPVVALELEFFLLETPLDEHAQPRIASNPATGVPERTTQVYHMRDLDDFQPFLDTVDAFVRGQDLPASAASSEYAPGQFEINLHHRDDPLAACDDAILLKRAIKAAARQHGLVASFMAKPFLDSSGSGTHVHASLYDAAGENLFAAAPERLQHALGGLQARAAELMLLAAPHANSYRRFQPDNFVPLSPCWGHNNRTVALRIPESPDEARRIEHRIAGADANPYLLPAAVLASVLDGLHRRLPPDAPVEGDAGKQREATLPNDWLTAIEGFAASAWVGEHLGERFQEIYGALKRTEHEQFQRQISPLEMLWCLTNA